MLCRVVAGCCICPRGCFCEPCTQAAASQVQLWVGTRCCWTWEQSAGSPEDGWWSCAAACPSGASMLLHCCRLAGVGYVKMRRMSRRRCAVCITACSSKR
jgi:hypothetical protein